MQDLMLKKIFIPLYYYIYKKRGGMECYEKLSRRNLFSRDDLYFIQWKKLKKLINYCYLKIPYYQKLFNSMDIHPKDIKTLQDYKRIPEFNKISIIDNKNDFLNPEYNEKDLIVEYTGISNGVPAKIYRTKNDKTYISALKSRSNSWCGWKYKDKTFGLVSFQNNISQFEPIKGLFSGFIVKNNNANTRNISQERMIEWVKQINKFKPDYLYGYSSLLEEFALFLTGKKIIMKGIKGVFSTVEPLSNRELISIAFNAPVYSEFSYPEVPCIGHECKYGKMHINIDEVLVEFQDSDETDGSRNLICTPLYLYGMPILRYNTGDLRIIEDDKICECGLPYPSVGLKLSKVNDNLISNNGKIVSGAVISSCIPTVTVGIRHFQIVQKDLLNIKIKLAKYNGSYEENEYNIRKLLFELMETNSLKINFEYYDKIPPDINGNFRPVISNISNNSNYKENIRTKIIYS